MSRGHGGPADQIVLALEQAGYDPSDRVSIERGMAAFMAAQTIAMAARSGEAFVDHGAQDGPLGGVVPEMIPLLEPRAMMADAEGLVTIFKEDPELRQVRFDAGSAAAWLDARIHERPEGKDDANSWLDEIAAEFAANGSNRQVVEGLSEQLRRAAPRWADRPAALRYIAAGQIFATLAQKDHGTNPLTAMLFRLSLGEALEEAGERNRLLEALGVDIDYATKALAAGDDALPDGLGDVLSQMPSRDQEKLRELAEQQIDRLRQQIIDEDFQLHLPIPCVIEPLMAMLKLFKQAEAFEPDDERKVAWTKQIRELVSESALEELHSEDRRLYVEACEHWLETEASEYPEQEPLVRTLCQLGVSDSLVTVEGALVLATLSRHSFSTVPGAPAIDFDSLDVDARELERYGDFLVQRGYPTLALRTYLEGEALQTASPELETKIADLEKDLGSGDDQGADT